MDDISKSIQENIASRKLNILKGFVGVEEHLEKAKNRAVGEMHANGKWVWAKTPSGHDWRVAKKKEAPKKEDKKSAEDHLKESDAWAKEISNPTSMSRGMTNSEIDEESAQSYRLYKIAKRREDVLQRRLMDEEEDDGVDEETLNDIQDKLNDLNIKYKINVFDDDSIAVYVKEYSDIDKVDLVLRRTGDLSSDQYDIIQE